MKKYLLVGLLHLVLGIYFTWPLLLNLNSLIIDPFDGLLITWFLNWDIHAIISGPGAWVNFYNANIFFPYERTLAFSEIMLPQALMSLPVVILFNEPLLAYNFTIFVGFVATGIAMFILAQYYTKRLLLAVFASIFFNFSFIHLNYLTHQQLFHIWPLIFSFYFFLKKRYVLFALFFLTASLTTSLFFYFLLTLLTLSLIQAFIKQRRLSAEEIAWIIIAVVVTAPFLVPYYLVSREFDYVRPINDAIHFSMQLPNLLNIPPHSSLSLVFGPLTTTGSSYPGVVVGLLSLYVFISEARKWGVKTLLLKPTTRTAFFFIVTLVCFVLALGPALHIFTDTIHVGPIPAIPLPYLILYYLIPGFAGFRTPSRWILLALLGVTVLMVVAFRRIRPSKLFLITCSALIILELHTPIALVKVPTRAQFPPEQQWLVHNYQGAPLIQFPIYNWSDFDGVGEETLRMYYSTIHWHPMFNGYSGFSPEEWQLQVGYLKREFPSSGTFVFLKRRGIKLILVPRDWRSRMQSFKQVQLRAEFPNTSIYELL